MTKIDVLRCLVEFVPEKQFLFFAPVSSSWKAAWGLRSQLTSFVTPDLSPSQVRYSFACDLPRDHLAICNMLARLGDRECLQFAREYGCPWDEGTCDQAVEGGHLSVLRWARQNGCPWGPKACSGAARGEHIDALRWAEKTGVHGTSIRALRLLREDISMCFNGQGRTVIRGASERVSALLGEGISMS